jgi:hypothetical protein
MSSESTAAKLSHAAEVINVGYIEAAACLLREAHANLAAAGEAAVNHFGEQTLLLAEELDHIQVRFARLYREIHQSAARIAHGGSIK